ncbi:hypothetical protein [Urbifossiella limnaea]|uniref:Uncharacterized protein n=1 Tax=Urbifossiella limnaea TaxID=2528023 RepID=A0A517XRQ0_9BACT|nr:hypothetical protein [Urbifossiella limnaea]QDU20188.1 hypothetical protein ETAA1_21330 [Urbifossiella limnaea]
MALECTDCGAGLTRADRDGDGYRCGRCGAQVREPRRTPDDYDDGPRRRRPKKSGNGPVLLVLGAIGLLVLFSCAGLVGVVVWSGKPRWEEFRSPAGGYSVDLPARARTDMADLAAAHGPVEPGVVYEGTLLLGRLEEYRVTHGDLDAEVRNTQTDAEILDGMVKNLRDDPPPAEVVSTKDITVSGFPARELHLRVEQQSALVRVVVTRTKWYTVIAGGPFTPVTEPRLRRFVESFKLNDPMAPAADKRLPPGR